MVEHLNHRVSARDLDYVLWETGQQARFKAFPRPRARTTSY
jgi:hypothetical protein